MGCDGCVCFDDQLLLQESYFFHFIPIFHYEYNEIIWDEGLLRVGGFGFEQRVWARAV